VILDKIIAHKRVEVEERKVRVPLSKLEKAAEAAPQVRDFASALKVAGYAPAVIAEIKKASPSKGVIREDFDPVSIALAYERAGAAAISVLTDEEFFQGSLDNLRAARESVKLPVLRKDFVVDPYQVWESRAAGADAVLLIATALRETELAELLSLTRDLGMCALVETHSEREVDTAAHCGARVIGINNRDLRSFRVDLTTTLRLLPHVPKDAVVVSESGITTRQDARFLKERGVDAVLVGEALMREPDPGLKLKELIG